MMDLNTVIDIFNLYNIIILYKKKMRFISSLIPTHTPIINEDFDDFVEKNSQFGNGYNSKELRFYQKFIINYLHPFFDYKHLLLNHSMGSGKTRTAFMLLWMYYTNNPHAKILIVVYSASQEMHFRDTLKKDSKSFSVDLNSVTLTIKTMKQFSESNVQHYDLIIFDEIHMIDYAHHEGVHSLKADSLYKKTERKLSHYLTTDTKIILMTGTPITREYFKFLEIINLILPHDEKFETKFTMGATDVHKLYFDADNNLKDDIKNKIIKRIRGKISTVKFKGPSQQVIEPEGFFDYKSGKIVNRMSPTTTPFTVNFIKLSPTQLNLVQHHNNNVEYSYVGIDYNKTISDFIATKTYKDLLEKFTNKDYFKNHSALYYSIFETLNVFDEIDHNTEAALYFNESIKDYGNTFFVDLLSVWGFRHVKRVKHASILNKLFSDMESNKSSKYDYKRVVSIHSPSTQDSKNVPGFYSPSDIQLIQSIYSNPKNKYGKYIRLIVGGKMITQGYNFINARQVHIVLQTDAGFMSQAIARAIRNVTHHTEAESYVKVYRYVVGGDKIDNSLLPFGKRIQKLNMEMRRNSQILSIIDKASVDCSRNKTMHMRMLKDYSQECNYTLCEDNFNCYKRSSAYSDNSLVVLKPSDDDFKGYHKFITQLFQKIHSITLEDLLRISPFTKGETFYYTLKLMTDLIMIHDRHGRWAKLREYNDIFYLSLHKEAASFTNSIESITKPIRLQYDITLFENDLIYLLKENELAIVDFLLGDVINLSEFELFPTLLKVYLYELIYIFVHVGNNTAEKYTNFLNEYKPYTFSKSDSDFPVVLRRYKIDTAHFLYEHFHNKSHSILINTIPMLRVFRKESWETLYLSKYENKTILDHVNGLPETKPDGLRNDKAPKIPFTKYIKRVIIDDVEHLKLMPTKSPKDKGQFCKTVKKDKMLAYIEELTQYIHHHNLSIDVVSNNELKRYSIPRLCKYAINLQDKIIIIP